MNKLKLILFDVNETLLDLSPMEQRMNQAFENENAFKLWFYLMLQYAWVENSIGTYSNLGEVGKATMSMLNKQLGKSVTEQKQQELLRMIRSLKPHPDVKPALAQLKEAGFRLVSFTNSAQQVAEEQMRNAGLDEYLEEIMSVDLVQKYKPAPETYLKAINHLNASPEETLFIAAHGWDVAGAANAGLQTGFIDRPGQALYPLAPTPTYQGKTLLELASQLTTL
ncbi:haloacid dehalogenase type II [Pontibacter oryzae]|uniref:Haloacid dehalogenase type II n=1 Tax=Pontibacter oryzae TaxID=2304593 RepID=A0A399SJP6_9BACT|nr:haloacid dehalogenase type II [Pontibacter oryzae]RIJ42713.1 haloacid dehalogenase type II [Pontibacter oryzae]